MNISSSFCFCVKTDHALNVFADPAEPPYVSRDEGEGDRMEARGGSLGGRHGREVHLHSHLMRIIVNHILSFFFCVFLFKCKLGPVSGT